MIGDGMIGFLDDRMDFDMRLNARGLPGVLLFPVSKLLEYETRGKFSKPNWHAKIMPKFSNGEEREKPVRPAVKREAKENRPRETNPRGR
jgi:hypothetical protein